MMKQKEIWLINLDPAVGAEIKKTRPCVILNSDSVGVLPLKIIAPLTDFKEHYRDIPWMVALTPDKNNRLEKKSSADVFQLRSLSEDRFVKKLGEISQKDFISIQNAIKDVFDLNF